jgi:hypothetical protein
VADRLLTDDELRAAARRRPGYATYPQYRPSSRERLGRLPGVSLRRSGPPPVELDPTPTLPAAESPVPAAASTAPRAAALRPQLDDRRPWWRPRWSWGVLHADGAVVLRHSWTRAGARRRADRAARKANR